MIRDQLHREKLRIRQTLAHYFLSSSVCRLVCVSSCFRYLPSRRDFLRAGALTPLGVSLSGVLAQEAAAATARNTNCILLWMLGGPSHIDMYDLKPYAPAEIRGEFNPIQTRLAGVELGELMPNLAKCNDKFSLIRSMHSYTSSHGTEQAFDLLTSQRAKRAFDIEQEPKRIRDAYGRNRVGQGLLLARRLIESGVRFVTVKGYVRYGWDHHPEVFPRLRTEVPPYDQGYAALLRDLDDRGMLENTLVITAGEFGRTPRLNTDARGPGRDHWSRAFSLTIGGGGIKTGMVLGATDKHAAEIIDRPVSVEDYAATVYHALGMAPRKVYHMLDGRPTESLPAGKVIPELIG